MIMTRKPNGNHVSIVNTAVVFTPFALTFCVGLPYVVFNGIHPIEIFTYLFMALTTGLAITVGYHRYYSHRSFKCHRLLQIYFLIFGVSAMQFSLLDWVSRHRDHHQYADTDKDPYNIKKGFFWAHLKWIFYSHAFKECNDYKNVPELLKDPVVIWQHRYALEIACAVSILVPLIIGCLSDHIVGCLLWGGPIRIFMVHHHTFLVNSAAHTFGSRPYLANSTARNNVWVALFTLGEGYHNYHHAHPQDYRNGVKWYQIDLSKWVIYGLYRLKLCSNLKRSNPSRQALPPRSSREF